MGQKLRLLSQDIPINSSQQKKICIRWGALVQSVPWAKQVPVKEILECYKRSIPYPPEKTVVVFDGYPEYPTTKDITHLRRATSSCPDIEVGLNTVIDVTKTQFLSNKRNKQRFLDLLANYLEHGGIGVKRAEQDADFLIAITALKMLEENTCIQVLADDTDVLILLIHHYMGLTLKPKNCMLSMKTKNSIFNIIQLAREGDKLSWVR